jgi:hypothetical protein
VTPGIKERTEYQKQLAEGQAQLAEARAREAEREAVERSERAKALEEQAREYAEEQRAVAAAAAQRRAAEQRAQIAAASHFCPNCGAFGSPRKVIPGSDVTSAFLLVLAPPLGLLNSAARERGRKEVCPVCGREGMIPSSSPLAQERRRALLNPPSPQSAPTSAAPAIGADGPGTYHIVGVDRHTKMDTEWRVEAASRENARVKAELEGIIVTSVVLEGP